MRLTVKVICHPVTGQSKGYGFVKFSSEKDAAAALEKMSDEVRIVLHGFCGIAEEAKFLQDNMQCSVQFFYLC